VQQGAAPVALPEPGEEAGHARGFFLRAQVRGRRSGGAIATQQAFGRRGTFHHEGVTGAQLLQQGQGEAISDMVLLQPCGEMLRAECSLYVLTAILSSWRAPVGLKSGSKAAKHAGQTSGQ
jgi:hypothetical protein